MTEDVWARLCSREEDGSSPAANYGSGGYSVSGP